MIIFRFIPLLMLFHVVRSLIIEYLRDENNLQIVYDDLMQIDFGISNTDHLKRIAASPKKLDKLNRKDLLKQAIQARVKDLECGIKIMALSVMSVTNIPMNYIKSLLEKNYIGIPLMMMYNVPMFCQTAHKMLRILYNLGLKNILDVWMFAMLNCEAPYSNNGEVLSNLIKASELIYQELKDSTKKCNVESTHDITNPRHMLHIEYITLISSSQINLMVVYEFEKKVFNKVKGALSMHDESNIILKNLDKIYPNNLYLRHYHYIYFNDATGYLQKYYGSGIEWGNAISIIKKSREEAVGIEKLLNRFESIKLLHTQFLAQMKIIFSRLIATYILVICDKIANKKNEFMSEEDMKYFVLNANYKIKQKIDLFTTVTGYSRKKYFATLKEFFSSDVNVFYEQKDFHINIIKKKLKDLCQMFGKKCNATKKLETISFDFDDLNKSYQNIVKTVIVQKPDLVGNDDEFITINNDNTYRVYKIIYTFVKHLGFILENFDCHLINEIH